jgi:hypothetical protein
MQTVVIPDWIVVPWVCVLVQSTIEGAGQGVKSKASTKFVERTAEHPNGWDLVLELSQRMAEDLIEI